MAFGRGRTDEFEAGSTASSSAPAESAGGLTAFIDQGSSFEGKLSFKDTVRIDGHFRGEITSENTLVIGESGEIEANVRSQTVIISGTILGDIQASKKVILHKTARVEGNIETPSVVVEDGATLDGTLRMGAKGTKTPLKAVAAGPDASAGAGAGATKATDSKPDPKANGAKS
jgi:cytoskeletal protein CcmA (bactofilin family)